MEEKVIIKSEHYNFKNVRNVFLIIGGIMLVLGLLLHTFGYTRRMSIFQDMMNGFDFASGALMDIGLVIIIIFAFVSWWIASYQLTVTDKRVYGKTSFGRSVNLPLDSISAVAAGYFKGIAVATSSGKIVFGLIKNRDEVHDAITSLLIERQGKQAKATEAKREMPQSDADELKKFKDLLNSGIITQEEFDAKKKQLLGL